MRRDICAMVFFAVLAVAVFVGVGYVPWYAGILLAFYGIASALASTGFVFMLLFPRVRRAHVQPTLSPEDRARIVELVRSGARQSMQILPTPVPQTTATVRSVHGFDIVDLRTELAEMRERRTVAIVNASRAARGLEAIKTPDVQPPTPVLPTERQRHIEL